jgi:hypothetical protein
MDDVQAVAPKSKADEIKEKFKNRGTAPVVTAPVVSSESTEGPSSTQDEHKAAEKARREAEKAQKEAEALSAIREKAKEREAMYSEVGQQRAEEHVVRKKKKEESKASYFHSTLRLQRNDLKRFRQLVARFVGENENLTYEKVFLVGLEKMEKMDDAELDKFVTKFFKRRNEE